MDIDVSRKAAIANINHSLNFGAALPEQVFLGEWNCFKVFSPDFVFDGGFVYIARSLIMAERSEVVALQRLPLIDSAVGVEGAIFIDIGTEAESYFNQIKGDGPEGWLYQFTEFACASDLGGWCIYMDRCAEVAIIAFKDESLLTALDFTSEESIFINPERFVGDVNDLGFPYCRFIDFWKKNLAKNYGSKSGSPISRP